MYQIMLAKIEEIYLNSRPTLEKYNVFDNGLKFETKARTSLCIGEFNRQTVSDSPK